MKTITALLVAASLAGCAKPTPDAYGEPIGIRLDTLQIAVAATKGKDLGSSVNDIAALFAGASKACPELAKLSADRMVRVKMSVEKGKLKAPASLPEEPVALCMTKALDGKTIFADASDLAIMADFKVEPTKGK